MPSIQINAIINSLSIFLWQVEKKKSAGLNGFLIKQPEIKPDNNDQPMEVDEDLPPIKETNNKIEVKERVCFFSYVLCLIYDIVYLYCGKS